MKDKDFDFTKHDGFWSSLTFKSLETDDPHAEIYHNHRQLVAIINQEKGIDKPNIELWPRRDGEPWEFDLQEFKDAIDAAYTKLKGFQLPPSDKTENTK